jgi:hypothetical protein
MEAFLRAVRSRHWVSVRSVSAEGRDLHIRFELWPRHKRKLFWSGRGWSERRYDVALLHFGDRSSSRGDLPRKRRLDCRPQNALVIM